MKTCLTRLTACCTALCAALAFNTAHAQLTMPQGGGQSSSAPAPAPAAPAPAPAPAAGQGQGGQPQQDPLTTEFRDCIKKARDAMEAKKQDDPASVLSCVTAEIKRQEGKVSASTAKAAKNLSADEKKRLDVANVAWRNFRDANCQFYSDAKGAMPAPLENGDCMLRITVGRMMEIEQINASAAQRNQAKASEAPAKK